VILLDTCCLLWRSFEKNTLSAKALFAIDDSSHTCISSISFWEIGIKVKNKKLALPSSMEDFVNSTKTIFGIQIIPVDEWIWLDSVNLNWPHRDPADRVLVATASKLNCPIVTSDKIISDYYPHIIW